MNILLEIHAVLRWAIMIVAVVLLIKYAFSWAMSRPFAGMDRGLAAGFSGLMDSQALVGFVYFLWSGFAGDGFPGYRWLHMIIMILAAALAHVPSRLNALGDKQRFGYSLVAVLGALILVYLGISVLE